MHAYGESTFTTLCLTCHNEICVYSVLEHTNTTSMASPQVLLYDAHYFNCHYI